MTAEIVREYIGNTKTLLGMNAARYGMLVERQVVFALLPKIQGQRAVLEPALWELLALLLDGHEGQVPALDDNAWAKAAEAATTGAAYSHDGPARFPKAASAVAKALGELRDVGVYPKPKLMHAG